MIVLDLDVDIPEATFLAPIALFQDPDATRDRPDLFWLGPDPSMISSSAIVAVPGSATITTPITINAPPNTLLIDQIQWNLQTFVPDTDGTLSPGEFTYNRSTGQVTISPIAPISPGTSFLFQVVPEPEFVESLPIPNSILPAIFTQYNLQGSIAWGCGWEQHPTATFEISCEQSEIATVRSLLIPKITAIDFFGIGFEVDSLDIEEDMPPSTEAVIRVSLRGKWEKYLEESIVLDSLRSPQFQFVIPREASQSGSIVPRSFFDRLRIDLVGGRTIRGDTTVQAIATRVGAKVFGPAMPIYAPRKAGEENMLSLGDVFASNLRHRGCFARYSNAQGIIAESYLATPTHQISMAEVGNEKFTTSVAYSPRAQNYKNSPLDWGSAAPGRSTFLEDTQGSRILNQRPMWRRKTPVRIVSVTGSMSVELPPAEIDELEISLASNNAGVTKEQQITYTEDGAIVRDIKIRYGFPIVAAEHLYTNGPDGWSFNPTSPINVWTEVERTDSEYFYDPETGYLDRIDTVGFILTPLRDDSDQSSLNATEETEGVYAYTAVPSFKRELFGVRQFNEKYGDIPPPETEEYTELVPEISDGGDRRYNTASISTSAGSSTVTGLTEVNGKSYLEVTHRVRIPGTVDPCYCEIQVSREIAFNSAPDPEDSEGVKPDLTTGKDEIREVIRDVPNFRTIVGSQPQDRKPDGTFQIEEFFIETDRSLLARDSGFRNAARQMNATQSSGRPGEHTRKVPQYEKIDPFSGLPEPQQYKYYISTIAYPDKRLEGDAKSYPYARTLQEALTGAAVDLEIANSRETETCAIQVPYKPFIREGDLVQLEGRGLWRVLSYSHKIDITAPGVVESLEGTSLTLGKFIPNPAINLERRPIPNPPASDLGGPASGSTNLSAARFELGGLVQGQSRGNRF